MKTENCSLKEDCKKNCAFFPDCQDDPKSCIKRDFEEILSELTPFEREIIEYQYGFAEAKHTLAETTEKFAVQKQTIVQARKRAFRKISRPKMRIKLEKCLFTAFSYSTDNYCVRVLQAVLGYKEKNMPYLQEEWKQREALSDTTKDAPIEDLDLSVRAYNCLKRKGYDNVSQIRASTKEQLLKIKNLGKSSVEEILKKIADFDDADNKNPSA